MEDSRTRWLKFPTIEECFEVAYRAIDTEDALIPSKSPIEVPNYNRKQDSSLEALESARIKSHRKKKRGLARHEQALRSSESLNLWKPKPNDTIGSIFQSVETDGLVQSTPVYSLLFSGLKKHIDRLPSPTREEEDKIENFQKIKKECIRIFYDNARNISLGGDLDSASLLKGPPENVKRKVCRKNLHQYPSKNVCYYKYRGSQSIQAMRIEIFGIIIINLHCLSLT